MSYFDELAAAQKEERAWLCLCGAENPPHYDACHTCQRLSWTCAGCDAVNASAYPHCGECGGTAHADALFTDDADDGTAPSGYEPPGREYATRPWGGPQLVAARAWLALVFWTAASTVRRHGTGVGVVIALAPVWAGVPARPALEVALVVMAAAVLARDGFQRIGNVLAPLACVPGADLHYRTPAAVDPCACGETATPDAAFRRMN